MKPQSFLASVLVALWLTGCATGPLLHQPVVYQSEAAEARQALATHQLAPSLNLPDHELLPRLNTVWQDTWPAIRDMCLRVFSSNCEKSMNEMRIVLVPDNSVNAYADSASFTIGIHKGFIRSAGDDDEIAAVIAHEAAHLLFGHARKKASNAARTGLLTGIAMGALGVALHHPGMDQNQIGNMTRDGFDAGFQAGYIAYSPEMELEADSSRCTC